MKAGHLAGCSLNWTSQSLSGVALTVVYVREFFGRKFNMVSLKFEGIWRTEQWSTYIWSRDVWRPSGASQANRVWKDHGMRYLGKEGSNPSPIFIFSALRGYKNTSRHLWVFVKAHRGWKRVKKHGDAQVLLGQALEDPTWRRICLFQ